MTYLFDDVTERLELERRYDALIRVQGETLDNSRRRRRGVRQRRPAAPAQSGLRATCGGSAPLRLAGRAAAHRDRDRLVPRRSTPTTRSGSGCAAPSPRIERPRADLGAARAPRRQRARLHHGAAARRRDAGDLPSTSPTRSTSSARCSSATRRWRPPTRSRVDFVHHVSYELRSPLTNIIGFAQLLGEPASTGPLITEKQREYLGYINTSLERAARDHQRHPRSRHHRRRRDEAQPRAGRHPRAPWRPRPRACRTAWSRTRSRSTSRAAPTSAASSPTSGACGRSCSICSSNAVGFSPRRRDRHAVGRAARRTRWCSR